MSTIRVGIFHPVDPIDQIPGGIDTVIRTVLKYAPQDLEYTLFGATSDVTARPAGREVLATIDDRPIRFVPLVSADRSGVRQRWPLSIRYMTELSRYIRSGRLNDIEVLDFHRIEFVALFRNDGRPKNLMLHQDMADVLRNKQCDIGWRHAPWLYDRLERWLVPGIDHVFCVRQSAIPRYQSTFPRISDRFEFLPTWVDTEVFYPAAGSAPRETVIRQFGLQQNAKILISVGRLDRQKDPLLLIDALRLVIAADPTIHLLMVGDGILRPEVEARLRALELTHAVTLLGPRQPREVADLLRGADLFVMSSAYEGMPIAVLEALASGVPVVTTKVGEVGRVVRQSVNGAIVDQRTPQALAADLSKALDNLTELRGRPCADAVNDYQPQRVLSRIYDNHRRLATQACHRQTDTNARI